MTIIVVTILDGLLLINSSVPDTIDERVLNVPTKGKNFNKFQMTENNNLVIFSAKGIGCNVVNIGLADLIEGREHFDFRTYLANN